MADRQFNIGGIQATPADWLLPDALEVIPKTAYAKYDGSGAAGSYKPCLRLISDSGHVLAEAVSDIVVAAGASADASWFPKVSAQAASGSSAGATTTIFHQQLTSSAPTMGTAAGVIPASFAHFQVVARLRTDRAVVNDIAVITMNGDSGANYDRASVTWTGIAIAFSSTYATTGMVLDCLGASADANRFATIQAVFVDYTDPSSFKNAQAVGAEIGAAADANVRLSLTTDWTWKSTAAINQITLTPQTGGVNFVAGSSLTIYGIPPIVGS